MTRVEARRWEDPPSDAHRKEILPCNARGLPNWREYTTGGDLVGTAAVTRRGCCVWGFFGIKLGSSAHFPGIAGMQEFVQVARATLGNYVFDLLIHHVLIAGQVVPGAKHADGCWESGTMLHVRKQEGVRRPGMMRVV